MIKTFEEFSWFNKKKIVPHSVHSDIDPYGEENWDDKESFMKFLEKNKALNKYKINLGFDLGFNVENWLDNTIEDKN